MITQHNNNSQSSRKTFFRVVRQISYTKLFKKYTSGNFSYFKILANNLIFNDTCRIVARFKDYLIFDDNTEFLRRFYSSEESKPRLDRILTFYETYSKIFPNYMILKESKYLYRNIRKKQKMIDAVNEIKREEEENRKKMKQNNGKINKEINELFTKRVKEEIKTFQENTTFEKHKNQFDSDNDDEFENENSISISVLNRKMFFENLDKKIGREVNPSDLGGEKSNSIYESFVANETNHSISGILNVLNDNKIYINDLPKLLEINNYSKNSQRLKNNQKKSIKEKMNSPQTQAQIQIQNQTQKQKTKNNNNNNQLLTSNNKLDKKDKLNKKNKKYEISTKQNNKNITNTNNNTNNNNNNGNYLSKKEFKKLSTPSTSSGTVFVANNEKNMNEINQYQNIIIPKGNTVININNNYFEQIASSSLPMGYYSNQKFKINSNTNINNNTLTNLTFKKSNVNNNINNKNSKTNNFLTEKKSLHLKPFKNIMNSNNDELVIKNNTKKCHYKQISQDYIYQKNKNNQPNNINNINKNDKIISKNEIDQNDIKEKIIKFGSLSPQPTITSVDTYQTEIKKIQKTKNNLKNENYFYKNYFTENNDPNLITGDTKGNKEDEEEEDNKEREKLLLHIRDLIENNKKENNANTNTNTNINNNNKNNIAEKENNPLLLSKKNKMKINFEIENRLYLTNFSKYKTISNFNEENQNLKKEDTQHCEEKCFSNKELDTITSDNLLSKTRIKANNKENINNINNDNQKNNKNEEKNKNSKINTNTHNKFGFKKLPVKEKKNKTKGILKNTNTNTNTNTNINTNTNNNFNTSTKLNKEKNRNVLQKTNNNLKNNKNLLTISNQDNTFLKTSNGNNKFVKNNKLFNKRNHQTMKPNKSEVEIPFDKTGIIQSHSKVYKSPNSQFAKLLMSRKKEERFFTENNTTTKIYFKGKIKNMKYKKDDLNIEMNPNSSCYSNLNNYCSENFNNKMILTESNNNTNTTNINPSQNSKTNKVLTRTHKINNSDLRNKYRSFLLKKNKQKSCEIENQSAIQQKMNKELLERMNLIKQNNKNSFYQNYKENKVKLGGIKSYIGNIESFDNLSNSNINMNKYSIGNAQNYARNSVHIDKGSFQTPLTENKKLGLYKKVIRQRPKLIKTDKKMGDKNGKNYETPSTIKVNRSKFLEKVNKDKFYDNNKMITMTNFSSCFSHKNF